MFKWSFPPSQIQQKVSCHALQYKSVYLYALNVVFFFSTGFTDFSPSQFTLTFEAGDPQCQCVQIPIADDPIYENSEMFHVILENITSDVIVTMGISTVIILDNDRKHAIHLSFYSFCIN